MSCISGLARFERLSQARAAEMEKELRAAQEELALQRQQRADLKQQTETTRQRCEDLQRRIKEKRLRQLEQQPRQRPAARVSCFAAICSSGEAQEWKIARYLKQLSEDLFVSKAAVDELRAQRLALEAGAEPQQEPEPAGTGGAAAPALSRFYLGARPQTRARVEELANNLQCVREELAQEREMSQQAEHERKQHDATATALKVELRGYSRSESLKLCAQGEAAGTLLSSPTPAQTRDAKERLRKALAALEAAEAQTAVEYEAHAKAHHNSTPLATPRGRRAR